MSDVFFHRNIELPVLVVIVELVDFLESGSIVIIRDNVDVGKGEYVRLAVCLQGVIQLNNTLFSGLFIFLLSNGIR